MKKLTHLLAVYLLILGGISPLAEAASTTVTTGQTVVLSNPGTGLTSSSATTSVALPSAPTNVSAIAGDRQATVQFTFGNTNSATITKYTVIASPGGAKADYMPPYYPPNFVGPVSLRGSVVLSGLTNGVSYTFTVSGTNIAGTGPASTPSNAVTPFGVLAVPTGISASASSKKISLTWAQAAGATGYNVYRSDSGISGTYTKVNQAVITATSYVDLTVTNGLTYRYQVRAVNSSVESAASSAVTVSLNFPPAIPVVTLGTVDNTSVTFSWSRNDSVESYIVYRSSSMNGVYTPLTPSNFPFTPTTYTDTQVSRGMNYYYKVVAINALAKSADSNIVVATPGASLAPITGLTAIAGNSQIVLSWNAVVGASGYNLYRFDSSNPNYIKINSSPILVDNYTDPSLTNGKTYTYQVTASFANGTETVRSSAVSATLSAGAVPAIPTGLSANGGDAKAVLVWNAVTGATSYNVYRIDPTMSNYIKVNITPVTTTTYTDTNLVNGRGYSYRVTAVNAAGESGQSFIANATPHVPVPLTTAQTLGTQYYIGVDLPGVSGADPDQLKAELNDRYIYFSDIQQTPFTLDISSYQVDRYFGYVTVDTIHQQYSGIGANTRQHIQYVLNDANRLSAIKSVKDGLTKGLSRLPSASDDYKNVSALISYLDAVPAPVDNGLFIYGLTDGWSADSVQGYYGYNFKVVSYNSMEGFNYGSSGGAHTFWGKARKIEIDMQSNQVNFYLDDNPVKATDYLSQFPNTLKATIRPTDAGWKQALREFLLIMRNNGFINWPTAESARATSDIEKYISAELAK